MKRSGPRAGAGVPLLATGTVVLVTLALTESFQVLPAALAAYAGAWWVLGLAPDDETVRPATGRSTGESIREETP